MISRYVLLHHVMGELEGIRGAWGYPEVSLSIICMISVWFLKSVFLGLSRGLTFNPYYLFDGRLLKSVLYKLCDGRFLKRVFSERYEHHENVMQGGMGGVSNAIAKSALAAGAELYTSR